MSDTSWYSEATLISNSGHIYCAGTLAQCVRRWRMLSDEQRMTTTLRSGRDGVPPTVMGREEISILAAEPGLARA